MPIDSGDNVKRRFAAANKATAAAAASVNGDDAQQQLLHSTSSQQTRASNKIRDAKLQSRRFLRRFGCPALVVAAVVFATTQLPPRQDDATPFRDFSLADGVIRSSNGTTTSAHAVFFNVYLHPFHLFRSLDIVREQLDQIARSSSIGDGDGGSSSGDHRTPAQFVVYYNTAGRLMRFARRYAVSEIQRACGAYSERRREAGAAAATNTVRCVHMNHYDSGFEEVTLQSLHDYCRRRNRRDGDEPTAAENAAPPGDNVGRNRGNNDIDNDGYTDLVEDERVTYMHNKGSYNPKEIVQNSYWRKFLTRAALSEECLDPPNGTCNACGLDFWPIWSPFFPGNMWTARCSYISQLLPPLGMDRHFQQSYDEIRRMQTSGRLNQGYLGQDPKMWPPIPDRFGLDRYAAEHWIGSHPGLVPCDCSNVWADHHMWGSDGADRTSDDLRWSMAPRYPLYWERKYHRLEGEPGPGQQQLQNPGDKDPNYYHVLVREPHRKIKLEFLQVRENRLRDPYLLPGLLQKWIFLYGKVPSVSLSWVWGWYPDGHHWRSRVREHGTRVLDAEL